MRQEKAADRGNIYKEKSNPRCHRTNEDRGSSGSGNEKSIKV